MTSTVNLIDVPGQLEERVGVLGVALAHWATRDDSKPQPEVRQAASTAMDEIDTMLADLHRARSALMDEMCGADDASAASRRYPAATGRDPHGPLVAPAPRICRNIGTSQVSALRRVPAVPLPRETAGPRLFR